MFTYVLAVFHLIVSVLPSFVSSRIYATIFGLSMGLDLKISGPIYKTTTTVTSKQRTTDIYSQQILANRSESSRTIVIVHGVASTAHEDPRIVTLAQAFAAAQPNSIVLIPYVPQLAEFRLKDGTVAEILEILQAIADDKMLTPTGKISIASPCISGGFSIVAASYMTVVESMFLVGPHADVENALKHALDRKGNDDSRYGINSVLAGFYHPPNEVLTRMLSAYCDDDHRRNVDIPSDTLQPLLEKYPDEAEEFHRLHNDGSYLTDKILEAYNVHREVFEGMSPVLRLDYLNTPSFTLVHSKTDDIVPPNESVVLRDALKKKKKGVSVSCLITSLLNHGDQTPLSVKDVPEILKLINTFSNFFRQPAPVSSDTCAEKKTS